jgi:hypothetical protein
VSLIDDDASSGGTVTVVIDLLRKAGVRVAGVYLFSTTARARERIEALGVAVQSVFDNVAQTAYLRDLTLEGRYVGEARGCPVFVSNTEFLELRREYKANAQRIRMICSRAVARIENTLSEFGVFCRLEPQAPIGTVRPHRLVIVQMHERTGFPTGGTHMPPPPQRTPTDGASSVATGM